MSAQCMALVRDNCLVPSKDASELGYIRESSDKQYVPDVFYKVSRKEKFSRFFFCRFSFISFFFILVFSFNYYIMSGGFAFEMKVSTFHGRV